jgi:hypothetical protein
MTTIKIQSNGLCGNAFGGAKTGAVFSLYIHGLQYPPELRDSPPRVRLLEDAHMGHTLCELVDPWPDAPEYWPPWSAPGFVAPTAKAAKATAPTACAAAATTTPLPLAPAPAPAAPLPRKRTKKTATP